MRGRFRIVCALCVASWISPAVPAEIRSATIGRDGKRYVASVEAAIDAPMARVKAVLTDYDHFERIHDSILESRRLELTPDGRQRVYVDARFCWLLICFGLKQTSQFWTTTGGELIAEMEPAASDFRFGHFRWRLIEESADRTRLQFDGEVEPTAWIPPVIGPWFLKRKLPGMAGRIASSVETLATESPQ